MYKKYLEHIFATASQSTLTFKILFEVTSDSISQYLEVIAVFQ